MKTMQATADIATEAKRTESRARPAWLRNAGFDGAFILGGLSLALLSGAVIVIEPSLLWPILILDLWVLGYHHVIASFSVPRPVPGIHRLRATMGRLQGCHTCAGADRGAGTERPAPSHHGNRGAVPILETNR